MIDKVISRNYKIIQTYVKIIVYSLVIILIITYKFKFKTYKREDVDELTRNPNSTMKYILLWTSPSWYHVPGQFRYLFQYKGLGDKSFHQRHCAHTNCYIESGRNNNDDFSRFHAVVFIMEEAVYYSIIELPKFRFPYQKFVITSTESSHNFPVCSDKFDGYFNWTWTYRLDSDCRFEYVVVLDIQKNIIGPKKVMHWIKVKDMDPVSDDLKESLQTKTKAAAWFVSHCDAKSQRDLFVKNLKRALAKYNHTIDVYGKCGNLSCPLGNQKCMNMIKSDYFFYLAFENSLSEDYVTEKLLLALKNNAIPIVYGSANYTRFMPRGIYLNAIKLGPWKLARTMNSLINNREKYANYFRWQNHYIYIHRTENKETDDLCSFCKLLNDEEKFKKVSVITNFQQWWDSPNFCPKYKFNNVTQKSSKSY